MKKKRTKSDRELLREIDRKLALHLLQRLDSGEMLKASVLGAAVQFLRTHAGDIEPTVAELEEQAKANIPKELLDRLPFPNPPLAETLADFNDEDDEE